jgi:hypothetical protein
MEGIGAERVIDPGPVTGSEDVGVLATAAGAPIVFWLLGGADPAVFARSSGLQDMARIVGGLPPNHSPLYAPVEDPTIRIGSTPSQPPPGNGSPGILPEGRLARSAPTQAARRGPGDHCQRGIPEWMIQYRWILACPRPRQ